MSRFIEKHAVKFSIKKRKLLICRDSCHGQQMSKFCHILSAIANMLRQIIKFSSEILNFETEGIPFQLVGSNS